MIDSKMEMIIGRKVYRITGMVAVRHVYNNTVSILCVLYAEYACNHICFLVMIMMMMLLLLLLFLLLSPH